ncbi:MAG: hypothetical protein ABSG46_13340 [Candidatus Binataceae bacterium]
MVSRPTITDWGLLVITLLYTGISLGLLKSTWQQMRITKEALILDKLQP